MSSFSLYDRFTKQGTISEPDGVPDPQKALPSSVNWMRALRLSLERKPVRYAQATAFYRAVQKRSMSAQQENSVLERLLLGLHQLAALQSMAGAETRADISRMAVIAWYYGVHAAASAMIAAQDGTVQETHAQVAKVWENQLVVRGLVMYPFDLRVSSLVKTDARGEVDALLAGGPRINLMKSPRTYADAHNALCAYLSGSATWYRERSELKLKKHQDFKALGVTDFRKANARAVRDRWLSKATVCFVHQAFRFRGKANYREALFLAHGHGVEGSVSEFPSDMAKVLEALLVMAGAFAFKRIGNSLAHAFVDDVTKYRAFTADPREVWPLPE